MRLSKDLINALFLAREDDVNTFLKKLQFQLLNPRYPSLSTQENSGD